MAAVEISPPSHCNYCPHFTDEEIQVKRETSPISQIHQQEAEVGLQTQVSLSLQRSALHEPLCSSFSAAGQRHRKSPGLGSRHCLQLAV